MKASEPKNRTQRPINTDDMGMGNHVKLLNCCDLSIKFLVFLSRFTFLSMNNCVLKNGRWAVRGCNPPLSNFIDCIIYIQVPFGPFLPPARSIFPLGLMVFCLFCALIHARESGGNCFDRFLTRYEGHRDIVIAVQILIGIDWVQQPILLQKITRNLQKQQKLQH